MPSTQSDQLFSVVDIGVIPCSKCSRPMRLSSIEPSKPGFDIRTFECERCHKTVQYSVSFVRGASLRDMSNADYSPEVAEPFMCQSSGRAAT
jgi:hypothetical protein